MSEDAAKIQEIIDYCLRARSGSGNLFDFRTRALLDMLLLELGKELARCVAHDAQPNDPQD